MTQRTSIWQYAPQRVQGSCTAGQAHAKALKDTVPFSSWHPNIRPASCQPPPSLDAPAHVGDCCAKTRMRSCKLSQIALARHCALGMWRVFKLQHREAEKTDLSKKLCLRTGMPVTRASRHLMRLSLPDSATTASGLAQPCMASGYHE